MSVCCSDLGGLVDSFASSPQEVEALDPGRVGCDQYRPIRVLGVTGERLALGQGDVRGQVGCLGAGGQTPDEQPYDNEHPEDQGEGQGRYQPSEGPYAGWLWRIGQDSWVSHGKTVRTRRG